MEEDIDVIVFATGYTFSFPFLEDSLVKVEGNSVSLYKYMFPPQLEKPTLACIGLIQPLGSIFPTVELQARWATRVFKGEWAAQPSGVLTFFSLNFTGREAALWWRSKASYSMGSWFSAATLWEPEIELRLWDLHTSMALPTEPYVSHRDKVLHFFLKVCLFLFVQHDTFLDRLFFFLFLGFISVQQKPRLPPSLCWDLVSQKEI